MGLKTYQLEFNREYLHLNKMQELHILKENNDKLNVSYIREMGFDLFTIILCSDHLTNILLQISKSDTLNLYIDATETVIHNAQGQKPVLVLIGCQSKGKAVMGICCRYDFKISLYTKNRNVLNTEQRRVHITGNTLKVIKTENDQSFAVMQACVKCFTGITLKEYLIHCCYALAVS